MNIPRKRSGSNSGKKIKEKYEVLFKNEETEEISVLIKEFLPCKTQLEYFEQEINKVNFEQSLIIKKNFNLLLKECINGLSGEGSWS